MIAVVLGRLAQFMLALAMMRVATTLLTPEEMGRVSLIVTTTALFALFLINPVGMFINRRINDWASRGVAVVYLNLYGFYLIFAALLSCLVLMLGQSFGVIKIGVPFHIFAILVCGSIIFNTINQTSIPSLNLLGYTRDFLLLSIGTTIASFVMAILLVNRFSPVSTNWLLGQLFGQVFFSVIGSIVLYKKLSIINKNTSERIPINLSATSWIRLYNYSWPIAIAASLAWLQGQGYRYVLEGYLGLAELGLFVAGYGISAGILAGFESVLTTYFQPRLYKAIGEQSILEDRANAWCSYASAIIPSLGLTVVVISLLAPELSTIFLGDHFRSAHKFILWGALAEAGRILIGVYSMVAHIQMRTNWLLFPNLIGACASMILSVLFIDEYGAVGVGFALIISSVLVLISMRIIFSRNLPNFICEGVLQKGLIPVLLLITLGALLRDFYHGENLYQIFMMAMLCGAGYLILLYYLIKEYLYKEVA